MDPVMIAMGILLVFAFLMIIIMNTRIKQLSTEINSVKANVQFTNDELHQLSKDIEDFKKLTI